MQREYRRLSRRTQLLLDQPEGREVEFKRDITGIKHKTLIAFANTHHGGTILVGVEETLSDSGAQRGRIVGCNVSDGARLQIQNKALSCIPPINIQIVTENLSQRPILRIEVPSGLNRPYCSQSGEYSIRSDGRIRALQPEELLELFMERESERFLMRFQRAVAKLETQMGSMDSELRQGVDQMLEDMHRLDRDTSFILNELYGSSRELRDEAHSARRHELEQDRRLRRIKQSVDRKYKEMSLRLKDLNLKVDALLARFSIEDPLRRRAREQISDMAAQIRERDNPALLADFRDVLSHIYPDIDTTTLERWISQAMANADTVKKALQHSASEGRDDAKPG